MNIPPTIVPIRTSLQAKGIAKPLTPQEMRVAEMMAAGLLNKQIAFRLGISIATVKAHASSVLKKFSLTSRKQLLGAYEPRNAYDSPQ